MTELDFSRIEVHSSSADVFDMPQLMMRPHERMYRGSLLPFPRRIEGGELFLSTADIEKYDAEQTNGGTQ